MRKVFVLMLLVMLLALPAAARAQAAVTLETLTIQIMPDYDQPSVWVIYDFNVSANTALPAAISLRLPADSDLLAVAKELNGRLIDVEHQTPVSGGDFDLVTFTITDLTSYHIEYYMPYQRNGPARDFVVSWPGDYAVKALDISLQGPAVATNTVTEPVLGNVSPQQGNKFIYHSGSFPALAANQPFSIKVHYEKDNNTWSYPSVEPSVPLDQPISGEVSLTTYLPWVLGGLGLLLVAGSVTWYWISSRNSAGSSKSRKRHASSSADDADDEESQIYCSQCGKRAQSSDRFCRTCGARLKQGEA